MPVTVQPLARMRFRHPWRAYQARVLGALDEHLRDGHLHVVAPPGSGKTVLGLEAVRRIGAPALVLVPTVTIREQWLRRLTQDFLGIEPAPGEISRDPLRPAPLTVSTYQAIYALCHRGQAQDLYTALRAAGITTLAADEAHHLRRQWWRCLSDLKEDLPVATTVALTGTPPYDAPQQEWNRYATFSGEVDEEIGVPELVLDGHLCPHQDLVYLCLPEPPELAEIQRLRAGLRAFVTDLALDTELAERLAADPRLRAPEGHREEVLRDAELWLAVAVFLSALRWEAAAPLLRALGLRRVRLPAFDLAWARVLVQGLALDQRFPDPALLEKGHALLQRLRGLGAVEGRRLVFEASAAHRRLLTSGASLLRAIATIAETESRTLDYRLRLVILTDHIRAKAFPTVHDPDRPAVELGVVPIFEHLRRLRLPGLVPCVLTGSLLVLPRPALDQLRTLAQGVDLGQLRARALWHTPEYLRVRLPASTRQRAVALVTRLFAEGHVNTIVGTASLLGEGWDAPAVNTLILASNVATYVTSNQMRGRAIRVRPGHPFKTANIWHLAGVAPQGPTPATPGPSRPCDATDLTTLAQRFRAFVGLALDEMAIENGLERLGEPTCPLTTGAVAAWNARMMHAAGRRDGLAARWQQALGPQTPGLRRVVRELRVDARRIPLALVARPGEDARGLCERIKRLWLGWRAQRRLGAIARATAEALGDLEVISPQREHHVSVRPGPRLEYRIALPAASHLDQTRFVRALDEVLRPLAATRYLLRHDGHYYGVPEACADHRRRAERFAQAWRHHVGRAQLIYARRPEGALHLLRARQQALAEHFRYRLDSRARWSTVDE